MFSVWVLRHLLQFIFVATKLGQSSANKKKEKKKPNHLFAKILRLLSKESKMHIIYILLQDFFLLRFQVTAIDKEVFRWQRLKACLEIGMDNEVSEHKIISKVTWRIIGKPKLDNLPLRTGSDVFIHLDSRKVILPWCHFLSGLASGRALFGADFVGWDGAGELSQGREPHLWPCQRLLSFQHPPVHTLVGHWHVESCIRLAQLQLLATQSRLQGMWGKSYLEPASSGNRLLLTPTSEEGILEGGVRLCKTIFRWESVKVSFSSLS